MIIHVDDTKLSGPKMEDIEWCEAEMAKQFKIKNVTNIKYYLGMQINHKPEKEIKLSQK